MPRVAAIYYLKCPIKKIYKAYKETGKYNPKTDVSKFIRKDPKVAIINHSQNQGKTSSRK